MIREGKRCCGCLVSGALWVVALNGCGTIAAAPVVHKSDPAPVESSVVQSLNKQLRDREKRIEELESQLRVLKLIDQDIERRKIPIRPPVTLKPIE
ncbi:MAG: hypothetical protein OEV08_09485 [Nitrospira sp.]|nr:hypothetical protein [Nitrospira sp.]